MACARPDTAVSQTLTVDVDSLQTPLVEISTLNTASCEGLDTVVVSVSRFEGGGTGPTFEFFVNGKSTANNPDYILVDRSLKTTQLKNGNIVTVIMTSSSLCRTKDKDTSNSIVVSVISKPVATILTPVGNGQTYTTGQPSVGLQSKVTWTNGFTGTWENTGQGTLGNTSTASSSLNGLSTPGTTEVRWIVSDSTTTCPSDTAKIYIHFVTGPWAFAGNDTAFCTNAIPVLQGKGSATGTWSAVSQNASISPTGTITSYVQGDNLFSYCVSDNQTACDTIKVAISPIVAASISIARTGMGGLGCEGDTVHLSATATPGTIVWSDSQTGSPVVVTNWRNNDRVTATLTSSVACASPVVSQSNVLTLNGTVRTPLSFDLSVLPASTTTLCPGPVTLTASTGQRGLSYKWVLSDGRASTDSAYGTVLTTGVSGTVTATAVGCFNSGDTVAVAQDIVFPVAAQVSVLLSTKPIRLCAGEDAPLLADGTGDIVSSYDWYVNGKPAGSTATGFIDLPGLADGDRVGVVARPAVACPGLLTADDATTVSVDARPLQGFTFGTGPVLFCGGRDTLLTSNETNPSYTYKWSSGTQGPPNSARASLAGDYTLTITNGVCTVPSTATLVDAGPWVAIAPRVTEFAPGDPVKLTTTVGGGTNGTSYLWTPAALAIPAVDAPTFYPSETGQVVVAVTNAQGCGATDTVLVQKVDRLFIPNAITPETGDQNAFWNIKGTEAYPDIDVRVYNRWGNLVHEQRGYANPWDGSLNGKPLPTATYYYVIKHKKLDKTRVGDLTIVR